MRHPLNASLTVFFTLLFSSILIFLLVLLTYSRRRLAQAGLRQDADLAGSCVLSEYEPRWVREYGLYMVPEQTLTDSCRFYLEGNLSHAYGSFQIRDLQTVPTATLAEREVLESEICSFMKERAALDSAQEVYDLLKDLCSCEQTSQELKTYENSLELTEIQLLYASLVTDTHGIRSDGGQNPYAIDLFLTREVTLDQVLQAASSEQPSSEDLETLEKAQGEIMEVLGLLGKARATARTLAAQIEDLERREKASAASSEGNQTSDTSLTDQLPVTPEDLQEDCSIWQENEELLEQAQGPLQELILLLDTPSAGKDGGAKSLSLLRKSCLEKVEKLEDYSYEVTFPYEYRQGKENLDLAHLLDYLRGYSVDVSSLAPDEDLDLPTEQLPQEENTDVSAFSIDFDRLDLVNFEKKYLTIEYCLGVFRNFRENAAWQEGKKPLNIRGEIKKVHFLHNEAEYLVCGRSNEYQNVNGVKNRMLAVRTVLDAAYLLSHADKRAQIESAAAATGGILMPGVGSAIAYGLVLTTWSLAESTGDIRILQSGGKVPLWKDEKSWRTDLSSLAEDFLKEEDAEHTSGLDYRQYLRIVLYFTDQDTLLRRIQDLLYMNHTEFSLSQAVVRFSVQGKVESDTAYTFSGEYGYVP